MRVVPVDCSSLFECDVGSVTEPVLSATKKMVLGACGRVLKFHMSCCTALIGVG